MDILFTYSQVFDAAIKHEIIKHKAINGLTGHISNRLHAIMREIMCKDILEWIDPDRFEISIAPATAKGPSGLVSYNALWIAMRIVAKTDADEVEFRLRWSDQYRIEDLGQLVIRELV